MGSPLIVVPLDAVTNITKMVQVVGVASEREAKLETKGMNQCTMIHSNFSM